MDSFHLEISFFEALPSFFAGIFASKTGGNHKQYVQPCY